MVIKSKEERNKYQTEYFHKRMKDPIERQKWNEYYRNYYHTKVKVTPDLLKRKHEHKKKYLAKAWEMVFNIYGNACACCGESNSYFLTLHHIHNDGQSDRISMGIKGQPVSPKYLKAAASQNDKKKYEILCYNCHYGLHQNNGICPHKFPHS